MLMKPNCFVLICFVEGKQGKREVKSMTRKENSTDDLCYSQCPCYQITKCAETKGYPRQSNTIDEILNDEDLMSEDCLGKHNNTIDACMDNNKLPDSTAPTKTTSEEDLQLIPAEIARKPEKQHNGGVAKYGEDSEYVSLNLHILKRAKSDGGINYKKRKPSCYFGRKAEDDNKVMLKRRARSEEVHRTIVQDEAGISESPVFFSSIGEWTVIDLDPEVFEKEDAKRIFYLRKKNASYKEVEPESFCKIL